LLQKFKRIQAKEGKDVKHAMDRDKKIKEMIKKEMEIRITEQVDLIEMKSKWNNMSSKSLSEDDMMDTDKLIEWLRNATHDQLITMGKLKSITSYELWKKERQGGSVTNKMLKSATTTSHASVLEIKKYRNMVPSYYTSADLKLSDCELGHKTLPRRWFNISFTPTAVFPFEKTTGGNVNGVTRKPLYRNHDVRRDESRAWFPNRTRYHGDNEGRHVALYEVKHMWNNHGKLIDDLDPMTKKNEINHTRDGDDNKLSLHNTKRERKRSGEPGQIIVRPKMMARNGVLLEDFKSAEMIEQYRRFIISRWAKYDEMINMKYTPYEIYQLTGDIKSDVSVKDENGDDIDDVDDVDDDDEKEDEKEDDTSDNDNHQDDDNDNDGDFDDSKRNSSSRKKLSRKTIQVKKKVKENKGKIKKKNKKKVEETVGKSKRKQNLGLYELYRAYHKLLYSPHIRTIENKLFLSHKPTYEVLIFSQIAKDRWLPAYSRMGKMSIFHVSKNDEGNVSRLIQEFVGPNIHHMLWYYNYSTTHFKWIHERFYRWMFQREAVNDEEEKERKDAKFDLCELVQKSTAGTAEAKKCRFQIFKYYENSDYNDDDDDIKRTIERFTNDEDDQHMIYRKMMSWNNTCLERKIRDILTLNIGAWKSYVTSMENQYDLQIEIDNLMHCDLEHQNLEAGTCCKSRTKCSKTLTEAKRKQLESKRHQFNQKQKKRLSSWTVSQKRNLIFLQGLCNCKSSSKVCFSCMNIHCAHKNHTCKCIRKKIKSNGTCPACSIRDCPWQNPLHYPDCPSCDSGIHSEEDVMSRFKENAIRKRREQEIITNKLYIEKEIKRRIKDKTLSEAGKSQFMRDKANILSSQTVTSEAILSTIHIVQDRPHMSHIITSIPKMAQSLLSLESSSSLSSLSTRSHKKILSYDMKRSLKDDKSEKSSSSTEDPIRKGTRDRPSEQVHKVKTDKGTRIEKESKNASRLGSTMKNGSSVKKKIVKKLDSSIEKKKQKNDRSATPEKKKKTETKSELKTTQSKTGICDRCKKTVKKAVGCVEPDCAKLLCHDCLQEYVTGKCNEHNPKCSWCKKIISTTHQYVCNNEDCDEVYHQKCSPDEPFEGLCKKHSKELIVGLDDEEDISEDESSKPDQPKKKKESKKSTMKVEKKIDKNLESDDDDDDDDQVKLDKVTETRVSTKKSEPPRKRKRSPSNSNSNYSSKSRSPSPHTREMSHSLSLSRVRHRRSRSRSSRKSRSKSLSKSKSPIRVRVRQLSPSRSRSRSRSKSKSQSRSRSRSKSSESEIVPKGSQKKKKKKL
jgi:hypothetical protein